MILPFEYIHKKHARAKSIKIKIEQGGKVVVVSPKYVPKWAANQFVKKQKDWIIKNLAKVTAGDKFDTDEFVFIFGIKYPKRIEFSAKHTTGVYIKNKEVIYNPLTKPNLSSEENRKKWSKKFQTKLDQFLKNTAHHYIIKRTHTLAKTMNLEFNNLTMRKQKTRWGSCSSQKNLNFNWKLVHFNVPIIDYVIVHELSHLVHMDHSKNFWNLVKIYDPEYLKHRGWLKRNGLNLR